ncbi:MAG: isoprenyl transferase [Deltaproteobacteria bacterium]|nr:isoprenyl transferase [Deltaproteobacteria bacterium]
MERLKKDKLPRHVAIIMDGNGRWAQKRLLNRVIGHEKGMDAVRRVVRNCREIGISYLTLYAFSNENWNRPSREVSALMILLERYLLKELPEMMENSVKLNAIGRIDLLPPSAQKTLQRCMKETENNNGMVLSLALSYGGRAEIIDGIHKIAGDIEKGRVKVEDITEELFSRYLYTDGMPDPDFLIRTSGEMRVSNFLLWQIAYAEIYVTDTLWPDFGEEDLINALIDFQKRERRFGLTGSQIANRR